jgi:hypothetical protein
MNDTAATASAPGATDHAAHYPGALAAAETARVHVRRKAWSESRKLDALIGIGLSGGGIRSATFCLGIFQALAKRPDSRPPRTPTANADPTRSPESDAPTLLERLDFLSTVSGGGYFGSFFGRLYTRAHICGTAAVARVLSNLDGATRGRETLRFLRENGRYIAPRGAGDLLTLVAITLRNWIAVQAVFIVGALTIFVALQSLGFALNPAIDNWIGPDWRPDWPIWLSPWIWLLALLAVLLLIPTLWAYWVVGQMSTRNEWWRRRSDIFTLIAVTPFLLPGSLWQRLPSVRGVLENLQSDGNAKLIAGVLGAAALATLVFSIACKVGAGFFDGVRLALGLIDKQNALNHAVRARSRLTRWFKRALIACGVVAAITFIDSLGATAYAILATRGFTTLGQSIVALLTGFAALSAFGRQLLVFVSNGSKRKGPRISVSIVSWVGAVLILGVWAIAIDTTSHGITWGFDLPNVAPGVVADPVPEVMSAKALTIKPEGGGTVVEPRIDPLPDVSDREPRKPLTFVVLGLLAILTAIVGNVRTFLNLSTMHAFYSQRLARAYLGASNERRHDAITAHVTDTIEGDDLHASYYWTWPSPTVAPAEEPTTTSPRDEPKTFSSRVRSLSSKIGGALRSAVRTTKAIFTERHDLESAEDAIHLKGGPLHLLNVTVNETYDNATGVQRQDRKGVPLAIGPAGFSVGVRHHLLADEGEGHLVFPQGTGQHSVFARKFKNKPEVLTLGRWAGISGAAFSSAMGANTTVPVALLATFANVRLGYWWDSGLDGGAAQWLPVYSGLLDEARAHLAGTAGRYWNVSDGGHFENLAGYELIRRRLPLIILVDAEADPDFEFPSLAQLVRKARLDFGAEIEFLEDPPSHQGMLKAIRRELPPKPEDPASQQELPKADDSIRHLGQLPGKLRAVLTSLRQIRRGPWNPPGEDAPGAALPAPADRERYSYRHAALARITYVDEPERRSWLLYLKASVTGDEPLDVLQYHASHNDFPHESTVDQFFDEAQWESYRRLGEHVGETVLTQEVFDDLTKLR